MTIADPMASLTFGLVEARIRILVTVGGLQVIKFQKSYLA